MVKTFFDIFPVPEFINIPTVGLSINDDAVSFVDLGFKKGKTFLEKHGIEELDSGVITDGEIKKSDEFIEILSDLRKKHNLSFVKASLPEEKAFLFRITLPDMSDSEIRESLQFKIEENVPISAKDAIFDFHTISDNDKKNVVVTVLSKDLVYQYLEVFEKSGLRPVVLKVESQAISEAVIEKGAQGTFLVVNVGREKTGLYLVSGGLVQFSSTLNLGSSFFDSSSLSKKENKPESDQTNEGMKVYVPESKETEVLKEEINKLLSYWNSIGSQNGVNSNVEKIISCGEGVLSKNFSDYFSLHFSIPLQAANVWVNTFSFEEYVPNIDFERSLKYAAAVGLAIPQGYNDPKI